VTSQYAGKTQGRRLLPHGPTPALLRSLGALCPPPHRASQEQFLPNHTPHLPHQRHLLSSCVFLLTDYSWKWIVTIHPIISFFVTNFKNIIKRLYSVKHMVLILMLKQVPANLKISRNSLFKSLELRLTSFCHYPSKFQYLLTLIQQVF
jgi:hypothetical protein